jgi:ABC-type Fe3+/spermidine/putrescine transport system ATPase subunit
MMTQLRIEEVTKHYGKVTALDRVNLDVRSGEFLVVMGPSGCGKTTLLLIILGVLKADSGHLYLDGKPIDELSVEDRNFGYVPQDFGLFPHMTARDNIAFGLRVRNLPKGEVKRRIEELLTLVELQGIEQRRPAELSGGQRQRVALARAIAIQPSLLLLDEPLSNVDEATKSEIRQKLKETVRLAGVTTVCVLHEPSDALVLGDRIAVTYAGKILQIGTVQDLVEEPESEVVTRLLASHLFKWDVRAPPEG